MDISETRTQLFMLSVLVVVVTVYFISPVLPPFIIALFVAYIANPGVTKLEDYGVPRWASMMLGIVALLTVVAITSFLLLPTLKDQFTLFVETLPVYINRVIEVIEPWLDKLLPVAAESSNSSQPVGQAVSELALDSLPINGEAAAKTADFVKSSTAILLKTLTNLFLIPVIAFYLLRDWNTIIDRIKRILPSDSRDLWVDLTLEVDSVLKSFLFGQFLVMISLGIMYSLGLFIIGVDFSLLIGVVSGLLSFVPFLGTAIGLLVASVVMIMQADQWVEVWKVLAVFSIGQFIEGNLLTPKLVGEQIDLHPVMVIFAVLAGGQLFGFFGVLLALPAAAVIWVVIKKLSGTDMPSY